MFTLKLTTQVVWLFSSVCLLPNIACRRKCISSSHTGFSDTICVSICLYKRMHITCTMVHFQMVSGLSKMMHWFHILDLMSFVGLLPEDFHIYILKHRNCCFEEFGWFPTCPFCFFLCLMAVNSFEYHSIGSIYSSFILQLLPPCQSFFCKEA